MSFISLKFALFFPVVLCLMLIVKDRKKQNILLLAASYVFYFLGDRRFLLLLVGVSLLMWFFGKQIAKKKNAKLFLILGVAADIAVLGIFKYLNFFVDSFRALIGKDPIALNILLPMGISFYIFQSISYIADVYAGKIDAEENPLNVLLYIGFFPQIISGPIVKSYDFLPQLHKERSIDKEGLSAGAQRFLLGLFKKKVIADRLGLCVDAVFSAPAAYSSFSILMAVITYSLQIYYDFSGYSDMAVGIGKTLGFDLGTNFNLPYLAKNPSDFWKRWHISLSSWFKEYVYIPLGGNRKGKERTYLNLFITMLLSGLWHGASWAFVFWGGMHAIVSVIHKMFHDLRKKLSGGKTAESRVGRFVSIIITYMAAALLWVPFRTNDIGKAAFIIKRLFSFESGIRYIYDYSIIFLILLVAVEIYAVVKNRGNDPIKPLDLGKFRNKVLFFCFIIIIVVFSYVGNTAFIYAQF